MERENDNELMTLVKDRLNYIKVTVFDGARTSRDGEMMIRSSHI